MEKKSKSATILVVDLRGNSLIFLVIYEMDKTITNHNHRE